MALVRRPRGASLELVGRGMTRDHLRRVIYLLAGRALFAIATSADLNTGVMDLLPIPLTDRFKRVAGSNSGSCAAFVGTP